MCFLLPLLSQLTVTATPKATKNGKPGYDDTTLPLMEKNQGQSVRVVECMLLFVSVSRTKGGRTRSGEMKTTSVTLLCSSLESSLPIHLMKNEMNNVRSLVTCVILKNLRSK